MTIHVREATDADWNGLWPLFLGMGTASNEAAAKSRFDRLSVGGSWLIVVALDDSDYLGYGAAQDYGEHLRAGRDGRAARLHDLFVIESRRRNGVGRALMDAVVEWARVRVSYLQWQAHEERSAPFYERLGYRGDPCPQPDYPEFEIAF